ncbi:hypothetical protein CRYUN_Cryun39dG0051400 [Craigia yunnanensis]
MDVHHSHILQISSLLPSTVCKSSTKVMNEKSSLPIVNKHGPCSGLNQGKENIAPSHAEILRQDQARADSIHSMLSLKSLEKKSLQSKPGISIGTGKYQVAMGFGSPKTELSLVFDTASQLTWTQCQPCAGYCYDQREPIFNPSKSSSYTYVRCPSATCNQISFQGMQRGCFSSTCLYGVAYTNTTFSAGFLAKEALTLTSSDVFQGFLFGCGQRNRFPNGGRAAGVLGLGRGWFSFVSQTAYKYHKIFSYCLPATDESTGYLKFGSANLPSSIKFTPMSKSLEGTHYYGLDMIDIGVGGERLSIDRSVFTTSDTVIDSASLITRLPPAAYRRVRNAFEAKMTKYPKAPAFENLGTCFDFSGYTTVLMPTISLYFDGGVEMPIDATGILYFNKISQACLAFAKNDDDNDVMILGNFQQKGYEVVYDDANGRIGFGAGRCS